MYSSIDSYGKHPGGLSIPSMLSHWTSQIIEPYSSSHRVSDASEYDIMMRFMVDIMFRQYLQEFVRGILAGQKTVGQLQIELMAMRELWAVNWMNLKLDGKALVANAHGHSLKTCYDNLNNPNYRHTGHSAAHHKCLWEYYLNQIVPGGSQYLPK